MKANRIVLTLAAPALAIAISATAQASPPSLMSWAAVTAPERTASRTAASAAATSSTGSDARSGNVPTGSVFTTAAARITSGATAMTFAAPCESLNRSRSAATWPIRWTPVTNTT